MNFYINIYKKKSNSELHQIASNSSIATETRLTCLEILNERKDINQEELELLNSLSAKNSSLINKKSFKEYSTFGDRFGAMFIDGILIQVLSYIPWLFSQFGISAYNQTSGIILTFLPYAYTIALHALYGQTFGKMLMNIKVYDVNENSDCSFKQALLRDIVPVTFLTLLFSLSFLEISLNPSLMITISLMLGFIVFIWSILEVITILFNSKRRAIHDYIARTTVLKIK